jgi:hypothetical protein
MMLHRSLIFAALLGTAATAAQADDRSFPAGAFDRVEVSGSSDVTITTGRAVAVTANGSAAALDHLDIHVSGNKLVISTKKTSGWSWTHNKVTVAVSVPMIRGIDSSGSADITINAVKTPSFTSSQSGSGDLSIGALDADSADFTLSGSGDARAAGRCGAGSVKISGSGDIDIGGLKCATLRASVFGSGDINAFATQTASASVAGSGDIRIRGGASCSISRGGSGDIDCSH